MMMFAAAFLSAVCAALGLGGGTVLMLYLTLFTSLAQPQAQGINLLVFLPVALLSLWFHQKNGLIHWKTVGFCILAGLPGVAVGCFLSGWMDVALLRKAFGIFILLMGIRELLTFRQKKSPPSASSPSNDKTQ